MLNGQIYPQCPRALYLLAHEERQLIAAYIECRDTKSWPDSGSYLDQTAYTIALFSFLDGEMGEWKEKLMKDQERKMSGNKKG